MSRRDLERALRNQGVAIILIGTAVFLLAASLLRKGVLTPKDLLADA